MIIPPIMFGTTLLRLNNACENYAIYRKIKSMGCKGSVFCWSYVRNPIVPIVSSKNACVAHEISMANVIVAASD